MIMTLQEAKDIVAREENYPSWGDVMTYMDEDYRVHRMLDRAAEMYARSKWEEACREVLSIYHGDNILIANDVFACGIIPEFKQ